MKTITVQEIIDAIKKNGLEWTRHSYFTDSGDREHPAACVFGQAAFNLSVNPSDIFHGLDVLGKDSISIIITDYNDNVAKSYEEVAMFAAGELMNLDPNATIECEDFDLNRWI